MNVKHGPNKIRADRHGWTEKRAVFPLRGSGHCSGLDADWNTKCLSSLLITMCLTTHTVLHTFLCICPEQCIKRCRSHKWYTYHNILSKWFLCCVCNKCHITLGCMLFFSVVVGGSSCLRIPFPLFVSLLFLCWLALKTHASWQCFKMKSLTKLLS